MKEMKMFGYVFALIAVGVIMFIATKGLTVTQDNLLYYAIGYVIVTRFLVYPSIGYSYAKFYESDSPRWMYYIPFYQEVLLATSKVQIIVYWSSLAASVGLALLFLFPPLGILFNMGMQMQDVTSILMIIQNSFLVAIAVNRTLVGRIYHATYNDLKEIENIELSAGVAEKSGKLFGVIIALAFYIPMIRTLSAMFLINMTSKFSKFKYSDLTKD